MSNPQINTLKTLGALQTMENDIVRILKKYAHISPLCSHEILGLASAETVLEIGNGIKSNKGGYSISASWIGSVASQMGKQH